MTRRTAISTLAALTAHAPRLVCAQAGADAQSHTDITRRLDRAARQLTGPQVPAIAVSATLAGETLLCEGYGLADIEHRVAAGATTRFQTGSVAKMFAACLALLHVRDGRIALDAPVAPLLNGAPDAFNTLTWRHLLTHTGGLAPYEPAVDLRRDYSDEELEAGIIDRGFDFAPGEDWAYSNTGYLLLGVLLSRLVGEFYGDQLRRRLFAPAGMAATEIISEAAIVPNRASGYEPEGNRLHNQSWVSPTFLRTADGACYTTAEDMLRWGLALRNGKVLTADEYTLLTRPTPQSLHHDNGNGSGYGMGMSVAQGQNHRFHGHGGSWQGFKAGFLRVLPDDLIITVNANSTAFDYDPALRQLAFAALGDALGDLAAIRV
ncbi:MAG: serine hydrolase domain-containing protein [Pseudomonadota bacterium]